jgi:YHS domain-containing protein
VVGEPALAQSIASNAERANTPRLALKGYDPVAYFTTGATPGLPEFEYLWDGLRYRVASAENLRLFRSHPDRYAPHFGGSCAMNMANGIRREADPQIWIISDGRLYVFAGQAGSDRFRLDIEANAQRAGSNWERLRAPVSRQE